MHAHAYFLTNLENIMKLFNVLAASIVFSATASAEGHALSLSLAQQAAQSAVEYCEADGYRVTAAVVDHSGEIKVLLKGDNSSVHTKDTAFRKAYTLVTLGPIFDFNKSSEAAKAFNGKPSESSFLSIPNIALLPGAAAIKIDGTIVASLGVGGAPGGDKDEACAIHGVKAIADQLSKS